MMLIVGVCFKMFYKNDVRIISMLENVYYHLQNDWDYTLIVVGGTGVGKSMFALHLLECWYDLILRKGVSKELAVQMASDYKVWLDNFKRIGAYEMNTYDEGATTLDSKSHMTKLSRDLTMLFNVFRAKFFFSVIILPSFFGLNKYFREERLRGLVWVDKRGHYKFYTKTGIDFLNAYNERAIIKSMYRARPFHQAGFPDYKGVLRQAYEVEKAKTVNGVLDKVIASVDGSSKVKSSLVDVYIDRVERMLNRGCTHKQIQDELGIGNSTVSRIKARLFEDGKFKP